MAILPARSLKAGYHRQGCCLAGAGRPQQRDKFPGCDVERQLANRKGSAVSFLKSRKGQRLTDQIRLSFQLLDALRRLPLDTAASGRNEKPSSDPGRVRTMRLLPRFWCPAGRLSPARVTEHVKAANSRWRDKSFAKPSHFIFVASKIHSVNRSREQNGGQCNRIARS